MTGVSTSWIWNGSNLCYACKAQRDTFFTTLCCQILNTVALSSDYSVSPTQLHLWCTANSATTTQNNENPIQLIKLCRGKQVEKYLPKVMSSLKKKRYLVELLTTSSIMDQCFYEWVTVLFDLVQAHEDAHRLFHRSTKRGNGPTNAAMCR